MERNAGKSNTEKSDQKSERYVSSNNKGRKKVYVPVFPILIAILMVISIVVVMALSLP